MPSDLDEETRPLREAVDKVIEERRERRMSKLKTRVYDLYKGKFNNITELAKAMGISPGHAYKVQQGKRRVNQKFIIGVMKVFPGRLDDYFYID